MNVIEIVDKLSQLNLIRSTKVSNGWYQCYCPFHSGGNERRPSFGILVEEQYRAGQLYPEGFCHCFTCGYARSIVDMITDILKNRSISMSGYDWLVANIPGFELSEGYELLIPDNLSEDVINKFSIKYIESKKENEFVSEEELSKYRYTVNYMYERKLTDEVINRYDIGVDLNWIPPGRSKKLPCITFPVHDIQGRTLFIARRSIEGKFFHYPEGIVKPLYGIDKISKGCKSLLIMESMFNALTAVVYGYDAVALLGTGNSYQIKQLIQLGIPEYVICTDGDEAGRRAAKKLKNQLSSYAFVYTVPMPDGKDANDLDKDEFDRLYSMRY